jgi:hypothetical protein
MKEINNKRGEKQTTKINTQENQKITKQKNEIRLSYGRVSSGQQVTD